MRDEQNPVSEAAVWIGADVSKGTFDAALARCGQRASSPLSELPARCFVRSPEGVAELLAWLRASGVAPESARMVMEATGRYSVELAAWMAQACPPLSPAIASPHQTAAFIKSLGLRNKTDRMDARALALYGVERRPRAYQPPPACEGELRELVRYRDFLVQQKVAAENRAEEMRDSKYVQRTMRRQIRQLERDIEKTEKEMARVKQATPELENDIELMTSIYGVAFLTAATIRAELGDLRRFEKARQLTAFAGLNPSLRQSGSSVHGRPHISKAGNPRVRRALYLSAMVAIRGDNDFRNDYERLRAEGLSKMAALCAIMRKILVLMRALLISGKPYVPLWKNQPHLQEKMCLEA